MGVSVHPSALVEDGACLGDQVDVGPFAYIGSGAVIGDRCRIGPRATIYGCVTLGADCQVHAGAVLGDVPQDLGFQGDASYVRIGDGCVLREGVTIHRGTKAGTTTVIGNRCMFMANSHAAHNVKTGDDVILANGALLGGYVEVGSRAFLSGTTLVHQFVHIGAVAMLGGGCAVSKDVPPYCIMRPVQLNRVAGLNVIGMRRAGLDADTRSAVKQVFKTLYLRGLHISDALERLHNDDVLEVPAAKALVTFVAASKRGVCGYLRSDASVQDDATA